MRRTLCFIPLICLEITIQLHGKPLDPRNGKEYILKYKKDEDRLAKLKKLILLLLLTIK